MIIKTWLHAGMCNQLFMIFAAIAYALRKNIDYILYAGDVRTIDNGNPVYFNTLLKKIKNKTSSDLDRKLPLYNEPEFAYNAIPIDIDRSFNMRGFFQSHKYFEDKFDEIMNITGINEVREQVRNEFDYIFNKKPCIAIHFRIGDYIGLQINHPIMPPKYYDEAFKFLETKINLNDYNIIYFCQRCDNERVTKYIETINKDRGYKFLKVPDDVFDWKQMLLISLCDHIIIANSTFSWWGAYMAENKNKIVCYPELWFGPALTKHNTNDLCPNTWNKINFL